MVTVFMNASSARVLSGTASDSGTPRQQSVAVSASVPACKKPRNSCGGIASLIKELEALLADLDPNSERYAAVKAKIASLLDTCASTAGCSASGGSCVPEAPMCGNYRCAVGEQCCDGVPYGNDPQCSTNGQCRRCLSSASVIATPLGDVSVMDLRVGDIVWTTDAAGNRIVRPLVKVSHVPAIGHRVVHLVLADGRSLDVSGPHPTADGQLVGDLQVGDAYDGSVVASAEVKPYEGSATYDILPASETGFYWANGILMGSTLK